MAEDIKEKIYNFLKESKEKINQKQLAEKLKISYPSILKWIEVLKAEEWRKPKIIIQDYGNVKLVGVE